MPSEVEVQRLVSRFVGEDAGLTRELNRVSRAATQVTRELTKAREAEELKQAADIAAKETTKDFTTAEIRQNAALRAAQAQFKAGTIGAETLAQANRQVINATQQGLDPLEALQTRLRRLQQAEKLRAQDQRRAIQLAKEQRTANERLVGQAAELRRLGRRGALPQESVTRGLEQIRRKQQELFPETKRLQQEFRELGRSLPGTQLQSFQSRFDRLSQLFQKGTISQQQFREQTQRLNREMTIAARRAERVAKAEQLRSKIQQRAAGIIRREETAAERLSRELQVLERAFRAGTISQEEFNKTSQRLRQSLKRARQAAGQLRPAVRGTGSDFKNLNLPITQVGFAFDDFITVASMSNFSLRGLTRGFQSAGNNIAQMIALLGGGGLAASMGIIATAAIPALLSALVGLRGAMKDNEEEAKEFGDRLSDLDQRLGQIGERVKGRIQQLEVFRKIREAGSLEQAQSIAQRETRKTAQDVEVLRVKLEDLDETLSDREGLGKTFSRDARKIREELIRSQMELGATREQAIQVIDSLTEGGAVASIDQFVRQLGGIVAGEETASFELGQKISELQRLNKGSVDNQEKLASLTSKRGELLEEILRLEEKAERLGEERLQARSRTLAEQRKIIAEVNTLIGGTIGPSERAQLQQLGIELGKNFDNAKLAAAALRVEIVKIQLERAKIIGDEQFILEIREKLIRAQEEFNRLKEKEKEKEEEIKETQREAERLQNKAIKLRRKFDEAFDFEKTKQELEELRPVLIDLFGENKGLEIFNEALEDAKETAEEIKNEIKGIQAVSAGSAEAFSRIREFLSGRPEDAGGDGAALGRLSDKEIEERRAEFKRQNKEARESAKQFGGPLPLIGSITGERTQNVRGAKTGGPFGLPLSQDEIARKEIQRRFGAIPTGPSAIPDLAKSAEDLARLGLSQRASAVLQFAKGLREPVQAPRPQEQDRDRKVTSVLEEIRDGIDALVDREPVEVEEADLTA